MRCSKPGALRPIDISRSPTTLSMALEATLGSANLLQLAEALYVKAERVQSDQNPTGFSESPDPKCRSVKSWRSV